MNSPSPVCQPSLSSERLGIWVNPVSPQSDAAESEMRPANKSSELDIPPSLQHFALMIIAIDGTLASGKGTIARAVASTFALPYMDTGRLYRATGIGALKAGIALDDGPRLATLAETLKPDAFDEHELRTAQAGQAASKVAAIPEVRAALLNLQRRFAQQAGGAVLDGRDIGTVICPDADVKLWIDADVAERARRRTKELNGLGNPITANQMTAELIERDTRDKSRATAPMKMAPDAVLIDTTDLSIEAAVDKACAVVKAAQNAGNRSF